MLKQYQQKSLNIFKRFTKIFPQKVNQKIINLLHSFLDGIVPLKNKKKYIIVIILSILIWACYGYIFQIMFYAFNFVETYSLPWNAALILLVITTISILVPSSPGYVGTYHYLCQFSLALYGVLGSPALTFAFVIHGISFLPILIVGLILIWYKRINIKKLQKNSEPGKICLKNYLL